MAQIAPENIDDKMEITETVSNNERMESVDHTSRTCCCKTGVEEMANSAWSDASYARDLESGIE
jgi:hypothetical protein